MRWHRIDEVQVRQCIMEPSLEQPAEGAKKHSWIAVGQKFLRVTWIEQQGNLLVITAVLKRRQPEGWTR